MSQIPKTISPGPAQKMLDETITETLALRLGVGLREGLFPDYGLTDKVGRSASGSGIVVGYGGRNNISLDVSSSSDDCSSINNSINMYSGNSGVLNDLLGNDSSSSSS